MPLAHRDVVDIKLFSNGTTTMQNETLGERKSICTVAADEAERGQFREEIRSLRVKLQGREGEPEAPAAWHTEISRPVPRTQTPPINIVIHEREAPRRREDWEPVVPRGVWAVGKVALFCMILAGSYYGPPYYSCRTMKEQGLFYSGTTVGTCMQERLAQRSDSLQAITRHILPVL